MDIRVVKKTATQKYNERMQKRSKPLKPKKVAFKGHREPKNSSWDRVVVSDPEIGKAKPSVEKVHVHTPKSQRKY
jgi:hypothetical protein